MSRSSDTPSANEPVVSDAPSDVSANWPALSDGQTDAEFVAESEATVKDLLNELVQRVGFHSEQEVSKWLAVIHKHFS